MTQTIAEPALDQLFRAARSYNAYLDKPVSTEQLHAIWDLLKYGPTSANSLPARIVWVTSQAAKEKLVSCVIESNAAKIISAPATAIIGFDLDYHNHLPELFPHTDAKSWFEGNEPLREATAFRNSSLQGAYLILAARAIGLDTGPISGFDNAAVDAAFFAATPRVKSNFITTIGYGDPASIFDRSPRPAFDKFNSIV